MSFFKKPVRQKSIKPYQGKYHTKLDEVGRKTMFKGVCNGHGSPQVSQNIFSSVDSTEVYTIGN